MKKVIFLIVLFCCSFALYAKSICSQDGRTLLVGATGRAIIHYDAVTGKFVHSLMFWNPIYNFKYTFNDHHVIVSSKDEIYLLDPISLHFQRSFKKLNTGPILDADLTQDQKYIIAIAENNHQIIILDVVSGKILKKIHARYTPEYVSMPSSNAFAYITTKNDEYLIKISLKNFTEEYVRKYDSKYI